MPGRPRGLFLPWFDGDRPIKLVVRQPEPELNQVERSYSNNPICYPSLDAIRPGVPLVVVEGEFEALLLGQELRGLASVITTGSALALPAVMEAARSASLIVAAHDIGGPGDSAAARWPGAIRARPPAGKDWCDSRLAGLSLRKYWAAKLGQFTDF